MGATAFRMKRGPGGQYTRRKDRRHAGEVNRSRSHESPPWYCFPLSAAAYEAQATKERLDAEREKRLAEAAARQRAEESVNRAKKIAERRAGMKYAPLSQLKAEAPQAPA